MEETLHSGIVSLSTPKRLLLVGTWMSIIVVIFWMPLIITGATSFQEAEEICVDNMFEEEMDAKYRNDAFWYLIPKHYFSTLSAGVSLLCFTGWLFASPHRSIQAGELDRKRKFVDSIHAS